MRRRGVWGGLLALVLVSAASVEVVSRQRTTGATEGSVGPVATTQLETYNQMATEYRTALTQLTWPTGVTPAPAPLATDRTASYEVGYGNGDAAARWLCAWQGSYLAERDSAPAAADAAVARMATIERLPAWETSYKDPNTRRTILDSLDKARLGDPSLIAQLHQANC